MILRLKSYSLRELNALLTTSLAFCLKGLHFFPVDSSRADDVMSLTCDVASCKSDFEPVTVTYECDEIIVHSSKHNVMCVEGQGVFRTFELDAANEPCLCQAHPPGLRLHR